MRIVHVITRLIIGGAQENTLLTVEGLHHHYRDDVTLITGPAEGPEGDLFDRAARAGPESRGDARAGPADPPGVDLKAYRKLAAAFRRLRPDVVHTHSSKAGHPRPGRRLARAGAGDRAHDPRHAVRAVRDAAQEPALHRARALGGPAVSRDRQRLRRDDHAGPGRRSRPARPVPDRLQRHGRRRVPEPARPREDVRRELGLADDDVAFATVARLFELKGHDDILAVAARRARGEPEGPLRLDRRRHPPRPADRRARSAGHPRVVHPHGAGPARAFPSCSRRSTR